MTILAWQGRMQNDRGLVIDRLKQVGPGHYVSNRPLPVWGSWKTLLRVQDGRTMTAVPIWAPADDAIPAPEIPAHGVQHPAVRAGGHASCSANATRTSRRGCSPPAAIVVLIFTLMVIAGAHLGRGPDQRRRQRTQATGAGEPRPAASGVMADGQGSARHCRSRRC